MSNRQSWVAGAAAVVGCLVLGMLLSRPSQADEKKADPEPAVGRYQLTQGEGKTILVIDSQTGHCWSNDSDGLPKNWHDLGSPAKEKKE
jgi:hypothetical protein